MESREDVFCKLAEGRCALVWLFHTGCAVFHIPKHAHVGEGSLGFTGTFQFKTQRRLWKTKCFGSAVVSLGSVAHAETLFCDTSSQKLSNSRPCRCCLSLSRQCVEESSQHCGFPHRPAAIPAQFRRIPGVTGQDHDAKDGTLPSCAARPESPGEAAYFP